MEENIQNNILNQENEIELNPDDVRQRQDTYNSLTDLTKINLFTRTFHDTMEEVKKKENAVYQEIEKKVFTEIINEEKDVDNEILSELFIQQHAITILPDYQKSDNSWSLLEAGVILIAAIAVATLYLFFFTTSKNKEKKI